MRKYIDPEYYCDACGKQVKNACDLFKVNVEYGNLGSHVWPLAYDPIEVCWDCRKEILDFIKDKMKQKKKGKKE